jgi:hypothetical protein
MKIPFSEKRYRKKAGRPAGWHEKPFIAAENYSGYHAMKTEMAEIWPMA